MTFRLLLLSLVVAMASPANAKGNEDRGGGDAVWVYGHPDWMQSLDYYMGIRLGYIDGLEDLTASLGPEDEDPYVKVERVLSRIERFSPTMATNARKLVNERFGNLIWINNGVDRINDEALEVDLDQFDMLTQAAFWVIANDGTIIWYASTPVWQGMHNIDRAGLVLHEIFYVLFVLDHDNDSQQPRNSRDVRHFVAMVSSKRFIDATESDWNTLLTQTNMTHLAH